MNRNESRGPLTCWRPLQLQGVAEGGDIQLRLLGWLAVVFGVVVDLLNFVGYHDTIKKYLPGFYGVLIHPGMATIVTALGLLILYKAQISTSVHALRASCRPALKALYPTTIGILFSEIHHGLIPGGRWLSIVAPISNGSRLFGETGTAEHATAHIQYLVGRSVYRELSSGTWLGEEFNVVDIRPGQTKHLVLLFSDSDPPRDFFALNDNRSDQQFEGARLTQIPIDLPRLTVKVKLISNNGRTIKTFKYLLLLDRDKRQIEMGRVTLWASFRRKISSFSKRKNPTASGLPSTNI